MKWRHNFDKFDKKRNAHRFWTIIAIKTVDSSLERYLTTNFKNRQFIDLRAHNFADVTFLKNKISTMWPRWWHHGILGSYKSKIFQLKYFWLSFRKSFSPNRNVALKQCQFYYQKGPLNLVPNNCRVKINNGTQSERCEIFSKKIFYLTKVLLKISKKDIKRKESQRSNPKYYLPEEAPKDMSLYESFWRRYRGC